MENVAGKNGRSPSRVLKVLLRNRLAVLGMIIIVLLVLGAVFAPLIAPYDYARQRLDRGYETSSKDFWLGTDEYGRDVFSRIVYGARISLAVGFLTVGIALSMGILVGVSAGYYGGKMGGVLMRLMDILLAMPSILLAIAIAASLGPGLFNLMVAVGISNIPRYARIARGSVLSIREMEYIEAAKAVGSSDLRILTRHVVPNCMAPLIVQATLGIASAILNAAALSFIGLGVQPPFPEWGAMLSEGRQFIRELPHLTIFPGLAIMFTILGFNFLGDGLRDALDPKLRR
ncbi:MAG: ABC transporter permease [Synergistaceae bacterium]|jgi:peptide/nickel transport system permease protein|nr:ABC transporter permease [Synergistaceae bacterium]